MVLAITLGAGGSCVCRDEILSLNSIDKKIPLKRKQLLVEALLTESEEMDSREREVQQYASGLEELVRYFYSYRGPTTSKKIVSEGVMSTDTTDHSGIMEKVGKLDAAASSNEGVVSEVKPEVDDNAKRVQQLKLAKRLLLTMQDQLQDVGAELKRSGDKAAAVKADELFHQADLLGEFLRAVRGALGVPDQTTLQSLESLCIQAEAHQDGAKLSLRKAKLLLQ